MITTNQELQTKELLQRDDIRTMKKDLAKLREYDSLREKQKISDIKTFKEDPEEPVEIKKEIIRDFQNKESFKNIQNNPPEVLLKNVEQEYPYQEEIREYANETEKQQIFLLQSERVNLENQLKSNNKEGFFNSEKNKMLSERKDWQDKLNKMLQEQENSPSEEQKQNIEKKIWSTESELAKIENKIKELSENDTQSKVQENDIKTKIAGIDNSLKALYSRISERGKIKKDLPVQSEKPAQVFAEKINTKNQFLRSFDPISSKILNNKNTEIKNIPQEKKYLKDIPLVAKEKLVKSTEVEETRRRKFMEDVEKWAAIASKNQEDQEIN